MLVVLMETPRTREEWDRWSFHHKTSHDNIRQAIQAKGGPNLADYPLYPINLDRFTEFLTANSQTHIDMDAALGAQSVDLQDVDVRNESQLRAWIWLHFLEHQTAENKLGLE